MAFTDEDLKMLNKLLKTAIEDTQFYQGYPDRCKAYAKALKAILPRLEAAENVVEGHIKLESDKINYDTFVGLLNDWRKASGKA